MKMVVAYVDAERFEPIREDLLDQGFVSLSMLHTRAARFPRRSSAAATAAATERHVRPKARLECVVGAEHASTVVDTVIEHGGDRTFVVVLPVERAYPDDTVKTGPVAVDRSIGG